MSGGHFNGNGYIYYRVNQFSDELESEILNNENKDEYNYCPNYNEQTLEVLRKQIPLIRKAAEIMRAIDYLYSGDHGEDSFIEKIKQIEESK